MKNYVILFVLTLSLLPNYIISQELSCRFKEKLQQIESYINDEMKARKIPGLVFGIFDGNSIVASGSYGLADVQNQVPVELETTFELASITKQFTASAILILQQDGKLKVTDKLSEYLDNCPGEWSEITIHQLLTHTSGLPGLWKDGKPNMIEMFSGVKTMDPFRVGLEINNWSKKFLIDAIKTDRLESRPGEVFRYSDVGYFLLGIIIDNVSGSYRKFLYQRIFEPAGMTFTYVQDLETIHSKEARGYTLRNDKLINIRRIVQMEIPSSFGVFSNIRDLQKWDVVLNTEKILNNDSKRLLWKNHLQDIDEKVSYGYGWFIPHSDGNKIVYHDGITGTEYWKSVDAEIAILVLTNLGIGNYDRVNNRGLTKGIADILDLSIN